tara:strand:- start:231 stop:719 length:489 start_codon:yes stop_codon:yes gene_type:complete
MDNHTAPHPNPNPMREWVKQQRAEQVARRFLANAPFCGDLAGAPRRSWNDIDPTWWSDVHHARLVRRADMLVAIETHKWRPRNLSSYELDALKRVLKRPSQAQPNIARVARAPPSRTRGLDAPDRAKAGPPPPKQPRIMGFVSQIARSTPPTQTSGPLARGD